MIYAYDILPHDFANMWEKWFHQGFSLNLGCVVLIVCSRCSDRSSILDEECWQGFAGHCMSAAGSMRHLIVVIEESCGDFDTAKMTSEFRSSKIVFSSHFDSLSALPSMTNDSLLPLISSSLLCSLLLSWKLFEDKLICFKWRVMFWDIMNSINAIQWRLALQMLLNVFWIPINEFDQFYSKEDLALNIYWFGWLILGRYLIAQWVASNVEWRWVTYFEFNQFDSA